jgi:hypothetical protein
MVKPSVIGTAVVKYSPSFSLFMGVTTRNANYVGVPAFGDSAVEVLPGCFLRPNALSSPLDFGAAVPTNRLGYILQNKTTMPMNLHVTQILTGYNDKYATQPVNATIAGPGTVYDNVTNGNVNVTTVQLAAGSAVYWILTLRSSALPNGTAAVESVGGLYLTVSQSPTVWPSAPVSM